MALVDSVALRPSVNRRRIRRVNRHGDDAGMTHPLREIRPDLAAVAGLIDLIISRNVDDVGVLRMELNENDGIATIAACDRGRKKEEGEQNLHEVATNITPITYSL